MSLIEKLAATAWVLGVVPIGWVYGSSGGAQFDTLYKAWVLVGFGALALTVLWGE